MTMILDIRAYSIEPPLSIFEKIYLTFTIGFSSLMWGIL